MSWRRATPDSNWFAGVVHRPCLECELLAPAEPAPWTAAEIPEGVDKGIYLGSR